MQKITRVLQETVATRKGRIWLAAGFVAAVTLLVAALLRAIGQVGSFGDGWWWAVRHLIDPGALGDDDTWTERLVGLALALSGIVIFVGVILEVLTEAVTRSLDYLDRKAIASTASDHVVFVGWSERLPVVVATLSDAAKVPGAPGWSREVVVLVPPDAGRERDEVRTLLRPYQGLLRLQVIMADLGEDGFALANCRSARTIIVLRDESRLEDPVVQDMESLRRSLLLSRHLGGAGGGAAQPTVIFEIARAGNIDAAARLVPDGFDPFVDDRLLSALLRDTLLEPAWSEAMPRLLDPCGAVQFDAVSGLGYGGLSFAELSSRLDGAVPVAVLPAGAPDDVRVAPPPDTVLAADDRLIVIMGRETPRIVPPLPLEPADVGEDSGRDDEPYPVLLIGWSSRVPTYFEELAQTLGICFRATSLASVPEAARLAEVAAEHREALDLRCLTGDPMRIADLAAAVEAVRPKAIVVTSTPIWGGASPPEVLRAADADALVTLMHVSQLATSDGRLVILDLFDSSSTDAFAEALDFETVPSTGIFASVMAWRVIEPDTEQRVQSLFDEAWVRRTSAVFRPPDGLARPFAAVHRALLDRRQAAIGIIGKDGLRLGPPRDHPVQPGDKLLVLERLDAAAGPRPEPRAGDPAAGCRAELPSP